MTESRKGVGEVFASAIKKVIQSNEPQMIVCIVPSANKDIYDSIKRICCVEFGIPSQVVTSNILNMNNQTKTKSVITKLAIQINCKLGGEIWGVHLPVNTIYKISY